MAQHFRLFIEALIVYKQKQLTISKSLKAYEILEEGRSSFTIGVSLGHFAQ